MPKGDAMATVRGRFPDLFRLRAHVETRARAIAGPFPHAKSLPCPGSTLGVVFHLPASGAFRNEGLLMFTLRYEEEADAVNLECSMEINHETMRDATASIRVSAAHPPLAEVDEFVARKVEQFAGLYRGKYHLGEEEPE
jgi:hypothetical protein